MSDLRWTIASLLMVVTACNQTGLSGSAGDGGAATVDLQIAAVPARPGREIVAGGATLRAGTLTLDAEVGHAIGQQKMTGGTVSLEGAAVVKRQPRRSPGNPFYARRARVFAARVIDSGRMK